MHPIINRGNRWMQFFSSPKTLLIKHSVSILILDQAALIDQDGFQPLLPHTWWLRP